MLNQTNILQASNLQAASNLASTLQQQQQQNSQLINQHNANTIAAAYGINQHLVTTANGATTGQTPAALTATSTNSNGVAQTHPQGQLIFPILQNLNEDVS